VGGASICFCANRHSASVFCLGGVGGGGGGGGVSTYHQNVTTKIIVKLCFGGQSIICGFSLFPGILESNPQRKASDRCNTKTSSENNAVMLYVSSVHVRIGFVTTFSHLW